MIISHKHRFIFIKTEKTAGTSLEIALSSFCDDSDIITPLVPEDEAVRQSVSGQAARNFYVPFGKYSFRKWGKLLIKGQRTKFYNHITAKEIKNFVDEDVWTNYFKFCFERNPWDKLISWYYWRYKTEPRPTISEFIDSGEAAKVSAYPLYTIDDQVAVDKVFMYERMEEELNELSSHLNLPYQLILPKANGGVRRDKRHYKDVLTSKERGAVANLFRREIKLFGYKY